MTPEEQAALDAEEANAAEESDDADVLEMSDEEFLKMEEPPDIEEEASTESEAGSTSEEEKEEAAGEEKEEEAGKEDEVDGDDPAGEEKETGSVDDDPAGSKKETEEAGEEKETDETPAKDPAKEKKSEAGEVDYEAEYKKLMAPFKANGITIQPKSTEDAVSLMQMGSNYHKKMSAIKPSLKLLKLLENNGLLDESKLNFLIDIDKKNPEAIKKLLKDGGLDPLDIKVDEESSYAPTNRQVSDTEVELDQVLQSIEDSPHYAKTLNVVSKEWDETSRKVIANRPQIIEVINAQMADGSFDKVTEAVAYQRTLGRLAGVPDFEAYKTVGQAMYEAGELGPKVDDSGTPADKIKPKKPDSKTEKERKKRKQAASSTKKVVDQAGEKTYDPLSMSDEEFKKFDETKAKKLGLLK